METVVYEKRLGEDIVLNIDVRKIPYCYGKDEEYKNVKGSAACSQCGFSSICHAEVCKRRGR